MGLVLKLFEFERPKIYQMPEIKYSCALHGELESRHVLTFFTDRLAETNLDRPTSVFCMKCLELYLKKVLKPRIRAK